MKWKKKHIISINNFSKEELLYVLRVAKQFDGKRKRRKLLLKGKIMGSLFYESSTRTKLSFHSAIKELGGKVVGFSEPKRSSFLKGESVYDTIKMVESYSDVIVIRHFIEGAARLASEVTSVPVLNAGDGANEHPTQTMLDLYTIQKEKRKLDNLHIGLVGDLKYGRTVHSLTRAMSLFKSTFYFIAPHALAMPSEYLKLLDDKKIKYHRTENLEKYISNLDILYITRIQKERFPDEAEYEKYKNIYVLTKKSLRQVKKGLKIMHPLPRVNEIDPEVDKTKYAVYFQQAANGIPIRKALLCLIMGVIK